MNTIFNSYGPALQQALENNVHMALQEDVGSGDKTGLLIPADQWVHAHLRVREAAVICGIPWFNAVFQALDPQMRLQWLFAEGAEVSPDTIICHIEGPARSLLTGERCALNLLQLLSAVATTTRQYVLQLQGTRTKVLDTRKTIPGLRLAQKYAVKIGGGENQRLALYDGILIKENHIAAAGGAVQAFQNAQTVANGVPIQIEVETLTQLQEVLAAGADSILLDNFDLNTLREAVALTAGRALLEVSGNVTVSSIRQLAALGVDRISVGALTKNLQAIDLSLRINGL